MKSMNLYWIECRYKPTGHVSVRPVWAYSPKQAYQYFFVSQKLRYGCIRYEYICLHDKEVL